MVDWDYHAETLEHKQHRMNDVSVNISMFGKSNVLGNDSVKEI